MPQTVTFDQEDSVSQAAPPAAGKSGGKDSSNTVRFDQDNGPTQAATAPDKPAPGTVRFDQEPNPSEKPGWLATANKAYEGEKPEPMGLNTTYGGNLLRRIGSGVGRTLMIAPNMADSAYHAFTDEPTEDESKLAITSPVTGRESLIGRTALAGKRMFIDPSVAAGQHVEDMARAQEARAKATGVPLAHPTQAKIAEGLGKVEASIPMVGPWALSEGERAGKGDIAGAMTDVAAMGALPEVAKEAMPGGELSTQPKGASAFPTVKAAQNLAAPLVRVGGRLIDASKVTGADLPVIGSVIKGVKAFKESGVGSPGVHTEDIPGATKSPSFLSNRGLGDSEAQKALIAKRQATVAKEAAAMNAKVNPASASVEKGAAGEVTPQPEPYSGPERRVTPSETALPRITQVGVQDQIERGLGNEPEHLGQFVNTNGPEIDSAIPKNKAGDQLRADLHKLSNVDLRQLAINTGVDMGQDIVGRGKNTTNVSRPEVFRRMLAKGWTPEDFRTAIDTDWQKSNKSVSGESQGATSVGEGLSKSGGSPPPELFPEGPKSPLDPAGNLRRFYQPSKPVRADLGRTAIVGELGRGGKTPLLSDAQTIADIQARYNYTPGETIGPAPRSWENPTPRGNEPLPKVRTAPSANAYFNGLDTAGERAKGSVTAPREVPQRVGPTKELIPLGGTAPVPELITPGRFNTEETLEQLRARYGGEYPRTPREFEANEREYKYGKVTPQHPGGGPEGATRLKAVDKQPQQEGVYGPIPRDAAERPQTGLPRINPDASEVRLGPENKLGMGPETELGVNVPKENPSQDQRYVSVNSVHPPRRLGEAGAEADYPSKPQQLIREVHGEDIGGEDLPRRGEFPIRTWDPNAAAQRTQSYLPKIGDQVSDEAYKQRGTDYDAIPTAESERYAKAVAEEKVRKEAAKAKSDEEAEAAKDATKKAALAPLEAKLDAADKAVAATKDLKGAEGANAYREARKLYTEVKKAITALKSGRGPQAKAAPSENVGAPYPLSPEEPAPRTRMTLAQRRAFLGKAGSSILRNAGEDVPPLEYKRNPQEVSSSAMVNRLGKRGAALLPTNNVLPWMRKR